MFESSLAYHRQPGFGDAQSGSVGALLSTEIAIGGGAGEGRDDGDHPPVNARLAGELLARPQVTRGYADPTATEPSMPRAGLNTGDIAVMDADGYVAIVDRKRDLMSLATTSCRAR